MSYKEQFKDLVQQVECNIEEYLETNKLREKETYSKKEAEIVATLSLINLVINQEAIEEAFEYADTYLEEK